MHRDHRSSRAVPTAVRHTRLPAAHERCGSCWGQRAIFEPSILGLVPVVCDACSGTGRRQEVLDRA